MYFSKLKQTNTLLFRPPTVIAPPNIHATTTVVFDDRTTFELDGNDLESLGSLGRGAYGDVEKMLHRPSGKIIAVKVS